MDFEKAFEDFLGNRDYDKAESALFSLVRTAFQAGWLAAGGALPQSRKIIDIKSGAFIRSGTDQGTKET